MGVDVFVQPEENDMIQKFSNYLKKLANYKDKYSRIYQSVGDVEIFEKQFTEWFRGGGKRKRNINPWNFELYFKVFSGNVVDMKNIRINSPWPYAMELLEIKVRMRGYEL